MMPHNVDGLLLAGTYTISLVSEAGSKPKYKIYPVDQWRGVISGSCFCLSKVLSARGLCRWACAKPSWQDPGSRDIPWFFIWQLFVYTIPGSLACRTWRAEDPGRT